MKVVFNVLVALAFGFCIFPSNATKPELSRLPEILSIIFNNLGLKDRLGVSQTNYQNRDIIFKDLKRQGVFSLILDTQNKVINVNYNETMIWQKSYGHTVEYLEEISQFFGYFGQFIGKFEIRSNPTDELISQSVCKQISQYIAKFVNEINFYRSAETIQNWIVPFPKAAIVKLSYGEIDVATLRQMFGAVHSLDARGVNMGESLSDFPNLVELVMPANWGTSTVGLSLSQQTIKSSPKLLHLTIMQCNCEFLQQLEKSRPENLSFEVDNLMFNGDVDESLRFKKTKVRKVSALNMSSKSLMKIANELPNLEEFSIDYYDMARVSINDIVKLLAKANEVKKVIFECDESERSTFVQLMQNKWENTQYQWGSCTFIRK